jgi:hypothetical protein
LENERDTQALGIEILRGKSSARGVGKGPRGLKLQASDPALHVTGALFIMNWIRRCDVRCWNRDVSIVG